jgi:hypothetical protein
MDTTALTLPRPRIADWVPSHDHRTDEIVGHVVRQTVTADGAVLPRDASGRIGTTVATVEGAGAFPVALAMARDVRADGQAYAVIDNVYRCGCRSY